MTTIRDTIQLTYKARDYSDKVQAQLDAMAELKPHFPSDVWPDLIQNWMNACTLLRVFQNEVAVLSSKLQDVQFINTRKKGEVSP